MQNNPGWAPPPPPPEDSVFGSGTRDHYAGLIRSGSTKALVYGILSIFCCPPIFAYLAYTTAEEVLTNIAVYQVEENRAGLAQAAKVLAIVGVVIWGIGTIARFALR
jgi:hypothetical protein